MQFFPLGSRLWVRASGEGFGAWDTFIFIGNLKMTLMPQTLKRNPKRIPELRVYGSLPIGIFLNLYSLVYPKPAGKNLCNAERPDRSPPSEFPLP